MAELNAKDKAQLAEIYDHPGFKSFEKLCNMKRGKIAAQAMGTDMSAANSGNVIAMLQGQYHALDFIQLEWKKIWKQVNKDK
jgi:hypothetical protein